MNDFYKITDLSEEFKRWEDDPESVKVLPVQTEVQLWQAKFMLAIAQQLSIVASHLGKIIRKANEPNGKD